jgi:hypothetical protein
MSLARRLLRHISATLRTLIQSKTSRISAEIGTDLLRVEVDAALHEYDALRREIESAITQAERTYSYLFSLTAAILAVIATLESGGHLSTAVNNQPWIFIVGALASLWFPIQYAIIASDMVSAAAYIDDVLRPKFDAMVDTARQSQTTAAAYAALQSWTKSYFATDPSLQGTFAWEAYRSRAFRPTMQRLASRVLSIARVSLLFIPTATLSAEFVNTARRKYKVWGHVPLVTWVAAGVAVLIIIALLVATLSVSNVARFQKGRWGGSGGGSGGEGLDRH